MNEEEKRQFILEQREAGISDEDIFDQLNKQNAIAADEIIREQRGFAGEILPTIGQIVGTAGGLPGTIFGGAAGEFAQQTVEKVSGKREEFSFPQITAAGLTGPIFELGAGVAGKALKAGKKAISPVISPIKKPVVKFLSKFSGYAEGIVEKALSRAPGVKAGLEKGEIALKDAIEKTLSKINDFNVVTQKEFSKELDNIIKFQSLGGRGAGASQTIQLQEIQNFTNSVNRVLRQNRIGINQEEKLIFGRTERKAASRITSSAEQNNIRLAYKELLSLRQDLSVKNVEAVLENIRALKRFETPTGLQTSKLLSDIMDEAEQAASTLYPDLGKLRLAYGEKRRLIEESQDLLSIRYWKKPTPKDLARAEKRLLQLYNTGNLPLRESAENIGILTQQDILGTAAGVTMKVGEQVSQRAPSLTKRGLATQIVQGIPRQILENFAKTGKITGELLDSPFMRKLNGIINFAAKAGSLEAINLLERKETE